MFFGKLLPFTEKYDITQECVDRKRGKHDGIF